MYWNNRFIVCSITVISICSIWAWRVIFLSLSAPPVTRVSIQRNSTANSYRVSVSKSVSNSNVTAILASNDTLVLPQLLEVVPPMLVNLSLKQVAENIWVPVSRDEQFKYSVFRPDCNNRTGYNYCCLGQCHQLHFQHPNPNDLLFKWVGENGRSMANMADLIRAAKRHLFGQDDSGSCNFVFLGDSLAADHAASAMCQASLLRDNFGNFVYEQRSSSCYPPFGFGVFGNGSCDSHGWNRSHQKYDQNYFELGRTNDDVSLCRSIIIIQFSLWDPFVNTIMPNVPALLSGLSRLPTPDKGIMLWNWGVHCNDPTTKCVEYSMNHTISRYAFDPQFRSWKMMWRETEPQHFVNTNDGQYNPKLAVRWSCGDVKEPGRWRNVAAHQFLSDQNLSHRVALVPIFEPLIPLWAFHYPSDCTHYCYSPWRVEITWDGMIRGLEYLAFTRSNVSENNTVIPK